MKPNRELKSPYLLIGLILGAIAGLLLAPSPGQETWRYLRAQSNQSLDYLNRRTGKLRAWAERALKKGREIMGCHRDSVDTTTEAEKQAYQEEKRETLGG
ncbi:MAG: YtxH domain-containing protein [Candidatus Binatia bacterium]|jgi:gas vesicle protein